MPEHRAQTPAECRDLESFLWHDFAAGEADWAAWVSRKMPSVPRTAAPEAWEDAASLHAALRSLQASNNGIACAPAGTAYEAMNRLITRLDVRPHLARDGTVQLAAEQDTGPVVLLLLSALHLMQTGQWHRFKLCRDPNCRASYFDASKPAAKTWCSMETCGSRNKMRRYRAKL
jgi:predicted RNA-binding Zn ribbon-like protein